jgi:hypothetical protein
LTVRSRTTIPGKSFAPVDHGERRQSLEEGWDVAKQYRSTKTGRFVTKKYAKKHPKKTVAEKRRSVRAAA